MSAQNPTTLQLLTEYALHDLKLRNRVVMAPMTRARAGESRTPNELMAEYYGQRASAGLVITEATVVSKQGIGWPQSPGMYNENQQEGWRAIVDAVHRKQGKIFLQLWHCGRASHPKYHGGEAPVAPSAIPMNGEIPTPDGREKPGTPRALATDEIPAIVEDYHQAAGRAKEAGFDGVEIHSANGYLLDQFLQSKTNRREDRYGGSVQSRYRLLGEVVDAVCRVWPSERVGVRLSPNGKFNDMGSEDFRETFTYVIKRLNEADLSYLHVIDGLDFGFHELGEPMTLEEVRPLYSSTLMGNCGYDLEGAEEQIESGHADLVAFGRPYISNPDLVERFANGWPLAPMADQDVWYAHDREGYVDFPTYPESG